MWGWILPKQLEDAGRDSNFCNYRMQLSGVAFCLHQSLMFFVAIPPTIETYMFGVCPLPPL